MRPRSVVCVEMTCVCARIVYGEGVGVCEKSLPALHTELGGVCMQNRRALYQNLCIVGTELAAENHAAMKTEKGDLTDRVFPGFIWDPSWGAVLMQRRCMRH